MALTTIQIGVPRSGRRALAGAGARGAFADRDIGLALIGAMVAIGGAVSSALAMTLFVVMIGYGTVAAQVARLGVPFLAITAPIAALWLVGAIQARRTIRRLRPAHELRDRAAFAELNALLARE
jgi:hypothetical protein